MHPRLDSEGSFTTRRSTCSLCIQSVDRYRVTGTLTDIERELLGVVFQAWEIASLYIWESYHSRNWPPVTSQAYGKGLLQLSSPRLQRRLLRLAQYDVHIKYLWGRENVIADALSRVAPLQPEPQDCNTSLNNIEKIPVHQITQIAPASPERLQEIHEATLKDPALRLLADTVHEGWPKMIRDCPHSIQSYWYFRDEITCEEGILYKGVRLIMPQSEQASTLKVLHMGHYTVNKMNLRARETIYWPGISEDIKVTYHKCEICAKFARTQQKETLQYVETPPSQMGTTWSRSVLIKKHTLSSSC